MKKTDAATAAALIIQGYLRSHEHWEKVEVPQDQALSDCLTAIIEECLDWAEGLDDHFPARRFMNFNLPTGHTLDGVKTHELAEELVALEGAERAHELVSQAADEPAPQS